MLLLSAAEYREPWLQYLSGYCAGSRRTLLFSSSVVPPSHLAAFPRVDGNRALLAFWREVRAVWLREEEIRLARAALVRLEIEFTPEEFCRCVADGEVRSVELFFQAGMGADVRNKQGVPILSLAVRGVHRTLIPLLLAAGSEVDAVAADRGNTALMDAAAAGNLELVTDLVDSGASLDVQSKNGQTALILAVGQGSVDIAVRLIEAGADYTIADSLGMSAIAYAKLFKQQQILVLIDRRVVSGAEG